LRCDTLVDGYTCLDVWKETDASAFTLVDEAVLAPPHHNTHHTPRDHNTKKKSTVLYFLFKTGFMTILRLPTESECVHKLTATYQVSNVTVFAYSNIQQK